MTAATTTIVRTAERNRLAFTPFALKRLPIPKPSQTPDGKPKLAQKDYWDNSTPGFGVRVTSMGTKSWVVMARLLGHPSVTRFTIGRYAEREGDGGLTLAHARREALALKERLARGENPQETEQATKAEALRRNAQTFRSVAEEFLRTHHPKKKPQLRPATLRRYTGLLLGADMAPWHARPLASITRADVIALLRGMQRRGVNVSANRALATLKKLMSWGIQQGLVEHSPCDHIQAPAAETPRIRHLFGSRLYNRPTELALLWRACDRVGPLGALPKLLMLTGQRLCEVAEMRAEELIELDGAHPRWHIPGTRTKNGKNHVVPLTPMAVKILHALPRILHCPFLFSTTGTSPMSGFRISKSVSIGKLHRYKEKTRCATRDNSPSRGCSTISEERSRLDSPNSVWPQTFETPWSIIARREWPHITIMRNWMHRNARRLSCGNSTLWAW